MKTILVTGANGQLGNEIRIVAQSSSDSYIFTDINHIDGVETTYLDITDLKAVRKIVTEHQVNAIVNCAAYTNVDKAEEDVALCTLLNRQAPENLAIAMKEVDGLLVHISTDYVFGGDSYNTPYKEEQQGTPTGVYGYTKFLGEQAIQAVGCNHVIIRTAWLYSEFGKNFCKTMMNLTATKPQLKVVFAQVGTPTYALDLARAIAMVLERFDGSQTGIYHYSNEGVCSWFDFTKMIAEYSGKTECDVQPCHSDEFPSPVKRPSYSVLDKTKIKKVFGVKIPYWTDSLKQCISNLKNQESIMAKRNIIITGGAGFIGSHVVRLFVNKYPDYNIINLDKLTYAGNLANLKDVEDKPNYKFVKMDICDFEAIYRLMQDEKIDGIIHLAAESHVDRSIKDPFTFARTNVMGTLSLLQAAKLYWESLPEGYAGKRFYHISTDEVYGALEMNHPEGIEPPFSTTASSTEHHLAYGDDFFYETTKYNPHSPYSAAKASSDHFVRAYHDTYGLPTIVTNCSNNYGPYQFPEKLIPLFINNIRHRKPLPVYGKGENVRDWLYVEDHARAIDLIFHQGKVAETYNIGGFNEWKNIDLIKVMIKTVDRILGNPKGHSLGLITYVADRLGHDTRYAIDSTKLQKELGWEPSLQFEEGIEKTVRWYLENQEWMDHVTSGDYQRYYENMYKAQ